MYLIPIKGAAQKIDPVPAAIFLDCQPTMNLAILANTSLVAITPSQIRASDNSIATYMPAPMVITVTQSFSDFVSPVPTQSRIFLPQLAVPTHLPASVDINRLATDFNYRPTVTFKKAKCMPWCAANSLDTHGKCMHIYGCGYSGGASSESLQGTPLRSAAKGRGNMLRMALVLLAGIAMILWRCVGWDC